MRANLLLTGPPRVGKTTLVLSVLRSLPSGAACGFVTREFQLVDQVSGWAKEMCAGA